jgi:putative ABC transport system permease protein
MSAFVSGRNPLALALTFALRDIRGGIRGFGIFILCIAIGVAAITGVAGVARGLSDGLAREGRTILGADAAFVHIHRESTAEERAFLEARGRVAPVAFIRAMVRAENGNSVLVEAKAVEGSYPVHGQAVTQPSATIAAHLAVRDGVPGAVADPILFARLGVSPGAVVTFGTQPIRLAAELVSEPDKLAGGVGFGPRLIVGQDALRTSGLLQPGSLVRWSYRVTLPGEATDADVARLIAETRAAFPEAGWEIRSRSNASPQFGRQLDRFTQFLTLVGLTALLVGGVGVANAARAFVDRRRNSMATLKSVGATGGFIFAVMMIEVLLIGLIGIALGLALGAAIPFGLAAFFGTLIPFPLAPTLYSDEMLKGAMYGLVVIVAFAAWPIGRAHDIPVSALFRDGIEPERVIPRLRYVALAFGAAVLLGAAAIAFAFDQRIATFYVLAAAVCFVLLRAVGSLIMWLAGRTPPPKRMEPRLALASLHRPGAITPSVVLSLGLGLTLLVALALIDANLRRTLTQNLPERAPSFFFLDIPSAEVDAFEGFLRETAGDVAIERVPMMRGRIVSLKGVRAEDYKAPEQAAWVLDGDRGITYAATPPANSRIVAGQWWVPDHTGPGLVSFTKDIADGLGLTIGDSLVVNVLGRNIPVTIANIRTVEWQSLGINFVMVFSPNTFRGAPHTHLATLAWKQTGDIQREVTLARAVAKRFPAISSVRVKDALEAVNELVAQLAVAIRGASGVALAASILVLAGALAAGQQNRIRDSVIFKTLGATRRRLLAIFVMEYGLLGLVTAVFGLLVGSAAAYGVVAHVMRAPFQMDWATAVWAVLVALVVTIVVGLLSTWRILGQKPAPYLRHI